MKNNRRAILGLLLVLIGVILLLDNLHIIPGLPRHIFSWPVLLIVIGVFNLVTGNRGAAIIFLAIGGVFYIQRYTHFYIDFHTWWPAILVIIGLAFILRRQHTTGTSGNPAENSDKFFDDLNIFGGSNKRFTSKSLEGGRITNIFGGSDIDLRDTSPVDGAVIEVFTMFGGCNIIVPPHWNVSIDTTAIFGGFEDKREPSNAKSDYTIYIKGLTIFGGGELKSSK